MTLHSKNGRGPYAHVQCDLLPQYEQIHVSLRYLTKGKNIISLSASILALEFYSLKGVTATPTYGTTHAPKMYKSTYLLYIKLMFKTENR